MQNFSLLALKLREEFVVKYGWTKNLELSQSDLVCQLGKTLTSQLPEQISSIHSSIFAKV